MSSKQRKAKSTNTEPAAPPAPTPQDYVAVRRLTTNDDVLLAAPGERCDRVPAESIGWLVAKGWIELAPTEGSEA
jgi:hypothetical protein